MLHSRQSIALLKKKRAFLKGNTAKNLRSSTLAFLSKNRVFAGKFFFVEKKRVLSLEGKQIFNT